MTAAGELDRREWLETNGLGGYAMSTVTGENTRRYHGLLVAATKPPVGRARAALEARGDAHRRRPAQSTSRRTASPARRIPEGFRVLTDFRMDPLPTFTWDADGVVAREGGLHAARRERRVRDVAAREGRTGRCGLELRPLVAFRDFHALTHENDGLDRGSRSRRQSSDAALRRPSARCSSRTTGERTQAGDWYRSFEYEEEKARGFDYAKTCGIPLTLSFTIRRNGGRRSPRRTAEPDRLDVLPLRGRHSPSTRTSWRGASSSHEERRNEALARASSSRAADQFLVARGEPDDRDRRLPVVRRLGPRHDDRAAGPHAGDRPPGGREGDSPGVLGAREPGDAAEPFPRRGRGTGVQHRRRDALVLRGRARSTWRRRATSRSSATASSGSSQDIVAWHERGTRYGIRVSADGLLEWRCRRRGSSRGWTRRSATGPSRRATASPSRFRRCGSTRSAR